MKKIYIAALFVVALCSCEHQTGIQGTWRTRHEGINGRGASVFYITFRSDGTYMETAHVDGLGSVRSSGRYEYVGDSQGTLYQYDRTEDGVYFPETREFQVTITGNTMYMTASYAEEPIIYHR